MTTDDKIKDEKPQYEINREAAKISALLSRKSDKYEYLIGEEILPLDQSRIIRKKQIEAITNQNRRLETLTNKGDHKNIYKKSV